MNLQERTMLASLHISAWAGTRTDKKVTTEVATTHAVKERRAGHYRKHAIDVDAPSFKAVKTAASELRATHMHYTLPWAEDGARILPAAHFDKYSDEIRRKRADFDAKVAAFVAAFPDLKAAARIELNGLYNEADYPKDIASKFGVKPVVYPLPDAADFRVKLPDSAVESIRATLADELQQATATAMREPYERLYAHIARMVERLKDKDTNNGKDKANIFRDTIVTGLAELCEVIPGLNITGDAKLAELCGKCESLIAGIDAQMLRESPVLRATVARQAEDIYNAMSAFMGGAS